MRKIWLLSLFVFVAANIAQAQSHACCSKAKISKADVKKLIKKQYVQAKIRRVKFDAGMYEASLVADNRKTKAYYSKAGKWHSSKVSLIKNDLPANIQQTLKANKQWNNIKTAYKISRPASANCPLCYVIGTNNGKHLMFDAKGKQCDPEKCKNCDPANCKSGQCVKTECTRSK